jgi:REP element-mobilizing transposase RayT
LSAPSRSRFCGGNESTQQLNRDREGADKRRISRHPGHYYSVATYLITFTCYGTYIPGQQGAIDRECNLLGARMPELRPRLRQSLDLSLKQAPFEINSSQRTIALKAIVDVCTHKRWLLHAVHIRSNHVHIVIDADVAPELAMTAFKAYASRALNAAYPVHRERIRWARHGSTRYLWSRESIDNAVAYVLDKQGDRMAFYEGPVRPSAP